MAKAEIVKLYSILFGKGTAHPLIATGRMLRRWTPCSHLVDFITIGARAQETPTRGCANPVQRRITGGRAMNRRAVP